MAQEQPPQQGLHAALIRPAASARGMKHFPGRHAEMLQEIRAARVDLDRKRP